MPAALRGPLPPGHRSIRSGRQRTLIWRRRLHLKCVHLPPAVRVQRYELCRRVRLHLGRIVTWRPLVMHNVPAELSSFVGRERERETIPLRLSKARLLTLVGPGGIGKTRLALRVAADVLANYPHGVWLVELASVTEPASVARAVASVVGVREASGRLLMPQVVQALHARQLLLILDNCEHLIDACAELIHELLRGCAHVQVLATSREALGLPGEVRIRVPPLAVPGPTTDPSELQAAESIQLFAQRAEAVSTTFVVDAKTAPMISEICRRLDGIPLAIELAAARVRLLSPSQMVPRLADRFSLLSSPRRDRPVRQQTLRSTIAWSYDLLSHSDQALFRCLAVFAGGCSLDAIAALRERLSGVEVVRGIASLADRSLLEVIEVAGERRVSMLETIREYALECLHAASEEVVARDRHLAFFLALAETIDPQLHGSAQAEFADRLEREHDNLRAAMSWSLRSGQPQLGLRLAMALRYFWKMHGHHREGRDWLQALLDRSAAIDPADVKGRALNALGYLEAMQAEYAPAKAHLEQGLHLGRQLADMAVVAFSRRYLGFIANARGDFVAAREHLEHSFALYQEIGHEREAGAFSLYLGDTALGERDYSRAERLFADSSAQLRQLGDTTLLPYPLRRLAQLALMRRDTERATRLCLESLALNRDVGDPQGIAACLVGLGAIAATTLNPERAARLLGAAHGLLASVETELLPHDRQQYEDALATARAQLGAVAFERAWASGRQLDADAAIADAPTEPRPRTEPGLGKLTPREREVLRLVATGQTNSEIGAALVLSEQTVARHLANIYPKIGARRRADAVAFALRNGLVG
jgi:predicted ATPase/DNA-binding CsgD family transcriptional regulator